MIQLPQPIAETADTLTFARGDLESFVDALEASEAERAFAETRREERLPGALVRRLGAGESPVRLFRQHRGLSAARLAKAAGVSASYLSEIETGRKPGSARALLALAQVLDVDVEDLID